MFEVMLEEILKLRSSGLTNVQIAKRLGIGLRTLSYIISGSRDTTEGIISRKIESFEIATNPRRYVRMSTEDRLRAAKKIMSSKKCYLSGRDIDLNDKSSWTIDHKIPRSRGGKNTVKNMGICDSIVNQSKADMTAMEFIKLCIEVARHNGYVVRKK